MASDAPQPDITSTEACMLSPAWGRFIYQSADRLSVCCNEVQQLMNPDITPNNREHSSIIHLMSYSNHSPAIKSESMTWRQMQSDSNHIHITRGLAHRHLLLDVRRNKTASVFSSFLGLMNFSCFQERKKNANETYKQWIIHASKHFPLSEELMHNLYDNFTIFQYFRAFPHSYWPILSTLFCS